MSLFRVDHLTLENFRCFEALSITFEADTTVLFAENGGGKSALLTALSMALALLQPRAPKALSLTGPRDVRRVRAVGGAWEQPGKCTIACEATMGLRPGVAWSVSAGATSRSRKLSLGEANPAIEEVRAPGLDWPLIAHYDTSRFSDGARPAVSKLGGFVDRMEGYTGSLERGASDAPLLSWLHGEVLGDFVALRQGGEARQLDLGVYEALVRATPGVQQVWYDPRIQAPIVRFQDGHEGSWLELSDGYHAYMALVGDVARRAIILNPHRGGEAPLHVEGVVLIDEIDQHLHPRWQRSVLAGLRAAFPRLQFIVTTHSPQVLGGALNRQGRALVDWKLAHQRLYIEGRDSNAILSEVMDADKRGPEGHRRLQDLYRAIDDGDLAGAAELLSRLRERWGTLDPELIRAEGLIDEGV